MARGGSTNATAGRPRNSPTATATRRSCRICGMCGVADECIARGRWPRAARATREEGGTPMTAGFHGRKISAGAKLLATGCAVGLLCCRTPAAAQAPGRVAIPIRQAVNSRGSVRFFVPITIGDEAPLDAMIDTGSPGLRVLRTALTAQAQIWPTGRPSRAHYTSGVMATGTVGMATIRFAAGAIGSSIPIEVVTQIRCTSGKPNCRGGQLSLDEFGFGGSGAAEEGFRAIIGISPAVEHGRRPDIPNPLEALGIERWIVELPHPGDHEPGRLILNPDKTDITGFEMFRTVDPGHGRIRGCIVNRDRHTRLCGPSILDTGADSIRIESPWLERRRHWQPGTLVALSFGGALHSEFYVGDLAPVSNIILVPSHRRGPNRLFLGVIPYYFYSVLYDAGRHKIGLRPRPFR